MRTLAEINKEYSDAIGKLGQLYVKRVEIKEEMQELRGRIFFLKKEAAVLPPEIGKADETVSQPQK